MNFFMTLSAPMQALIATMFTFFITVLGSSVVFFFKKVNKTIMDGLLGFAAGVMMAASYFSLLAPAIDQANNIGLISWIVVSLGFLTGGLLLFISDKVFDKILSNKKDFDKKKRIFLLISSITIHNIPDDCQNHVS